MATTICSCCLEMSAATTLVQRGYDNLFMLSDGECCYHAGDCDNLFMLSGGECCYHAGDCDNLFMLSGGECSYHAGDCDNLFMLSGGECCYRTGATWLRQSVHVVWR